MSETFDLGRILEAAIFAANRHHGQVRKDQRGSPYVTHPLAVAKALWEIGGIRDQETLMAAILHDTIEDTETTHDDIRQQFGENILDLILEVTDDKSLPTIERKRLQVVHAPSLSLKMRYLKLGDKLVNCQDVLVSPPKDWSLQRRRDYVQWSADVLAQIRGANSPLEAAFDQIVLTVEKQLDFTVQAFDSIGQRPWAP